jgi:hypothetical protein
MTDARGIVEANWPFDGPHDEDTIASAATAVDQLVRYMANATYRLPESGQGLWRIVSGLREAVSKLDQVLRYLSERAEGVVADDPILYDDRRDRPGADTAAEVAILLRLAREGLAEACKTLSQASAVASHLGNDEAVVGRG